MEEPDSDDDDEEEGGEGESDGDDGTKQAVQDKLADMEEDGDSDSVESEDEDGSDLDGEGAAVITTGMGEGEDEAEAMRRAAADLKRFQGLFDGLVFYVSREVPQDVMEFVLRSFGAKVISGALREDGSTGEDDESITHHVIDRPMGRKKGVEGREYVQPQWVFDSINARMLLPVRPYAPGATLPPHLSPFVDDVKEGYIPEYRKELDSLRSAAGVIRETEIARLDEDSDSDGDGDGDGDAAKASTDVGKVARPADESDDSDGLDSDAEVGLDSDEEGSDSDSGSDSEEEEEEELDAPKGPAVPLGKRKGGAQAANTRASKKAKPSRESKEMAASMLTNKERKRYDKVMHSVGRKKAAVQKLKDKAVAAKTGGAGSKGKGKGNKRART
jgi:pescadillo protein